MSVLIGSILLEVRLFIGSWDVGMLMVVGWLVHFSINSVPVCSVGSGGPGFEGSRVVGRLGRPVNNLGQLLLLSKPSWLGWTGGGLVEICRAVGGSGLEVMSIR